jgi:hypothetical protein
MKRKPYDKPMLVSQGTLPRVVAQTGTPAIPVPS